MKPARTWIVVVDGGQARFLQWMGLKSGARSIPGQVFSQHVPRSRELRRERPSRVNESRGATRHAIEPRVDAHTAQENQFLKEIVRQLQEAYGADAFDDLVVVAPPRALGSLRTMIPDELKPCIAAEIDKDMTGHTDAAVSELLARHVSEASP
jgi:protein required for attachment to host cells